jgi:hypothetical protein
MCDPAAATEAAQRIRDADAVRDESLRAWADSGGARGVAPRESLTAHPRYGESVRVEDIPAAIRQAMAAREQYLRDVPPACEDVDGTEARNESTFYVGDRFYVYGHFSEARALLEPLYRRSCTTSPLGYETWKRLLTMSLLERDNAQARRLALAQRDHPCAGTHDEPPSTVWDEPLISPFDDAAKVFAFATEAAPGPARDALLRKAAKLYEDILMAAPEHRDTPDGAMRAAWSYVQLGENLRAIHIYQLVIEHYGERFDLTPAAYDALSTLYFTCFAYDRAAQALAQIAVNAGFDPKRRARAALVAMELYADLGDRTNLIRVHGIARRETDPADGDRARADYLLASFDFKQWAVARPTAANETVRRNAIATLATFLEAYRALPSAAAYVVEATDHIATMNAVQSKRVAARSLESPGITDVVGPAGLPAPSP